MAAAFAQLIVSMTIAMSGFALALFPTDKLYVGRIGAILLVGALVNICTMVSLLGRAPPSPQTKEPK